MEDKPFATLTGEDGERYPATRENTYVYKHLARYALFDHVFVRTSETAGLYVWREAESFKAIAIAAMKNKCLAHLNIPEPSPTDVENYVKHATAGVKEELEEGVPEDWK